MYRQWGTVKSIIRNYETKKDVFLSVIDANGSIINANSKMQRSFHLESPKKKRTVIFDLIHPVYVTDFRTSLQQSAKEKKNFNTELFLKNSVYHPMRWQVSLLDDKRTGPLFLCIGHIVNDAGGKGIAKPANGNSVNGKAGPEKKPSIQNGAAESPVNMFSELMKSTPNPSWVVDENGCLVCGNPAFFNSLAIDGEAAVSKNIRELVPATISISLYEKHTGVLRGNNTTETEERILCADGSWFIYHINLFAINGNDGKKYVGGHAVNIAEKFAFERKLKEVNERLLLLSRATSDAIWEWDMLSGQIFRNDTLMEMTGYTQEDARGLSWWLRRIHPEDRDRVSEKVKLSSDNGRQTWEDEYRFRCADGSYKHMRDKGFIVYENGLPVKMIGSLQDISLLKEMEDKLVQEKLRSQQAISETIMKTQEEERTRIGHELHDNVNQIISTAKMFVDVLKPVSEEEKKLKAKTTEYLMLAVEEIRKLSRQLVLPQLKGNSLIQSAQSLLEDIHLSNSVKFKLTYDAGIDLISEGKKIALFRIIQEQIKNILKYSKASQAEILLQTRDNMAHLVIKDFGVGFDTTRTPGGIGLSNIHERTRFYNGVVSIQSAPGKGCMVSVALPVGD